MNFVTMGYLAFFAAVVIVFYTVPKRARWIVLLAASVFFYCHANPYYLIFLGIAILTTYLAALYMGRRDAILTVRIEKEKPDKETKKRLKKQAQSEKQVACAVALVITLGVLLVLKYYNFILSNLSRNWTAIELTLPLGISFYTFQAVGYCIDVYRGMCEPQHNFLKYALYVMYFPQLLQGPIGSYGELAPQLWSGASFDGERFRMGLFRVLWGFFKKLVIADRIAVLVNTLFDGYEQYQGVYIAIAAVAYAIQLYADFSGYMDIALGCSEMLGISLSENFDTPYFSKSISEFWRRWHISLGAWFRNYVFYSLERSRAWRTVGKKTAKLPKKLARNVPTACALLVVWILIGAWHGAAWKYIVYGLYHGGIIIFSLLLEPLFLWGKKKLQIRDTSIIWNSFCILRTFTLVCLGYILFRSNNLHSAGAMVKNLFRKTAGPALYDNVLNLGLSKMNLYLLSVSILVLFAVDFVNKRGVIVRRRLIAKPFWIQYLVALIGVFSVMIFGIYGMGYDASTFIYMQF